MSIPDHFRLTHQTFKVMSEGEVQPFLDKTDKKDGQGNHAEQNRCILVSANPIDRYTVACIFNHYYISSNDLQK